MTAIDDPIVYDPFSFEIQHNPYPTYERLREEAPVYHDPVRGFWALSRHDDVLAAHLDAETFISSKGVTLEGDEVTEGESPLLILKDSPDHEWHRKVVSRVFTPRYVNGLEPFMRQVACDLLDRQVGAGGFDVIEDFSVQFPLQVAGELFGIPEEHRQAIHHLSDRLVARDAGGNVSEDAIAARTEIGLLMYSLIVERRAHPGDDVISLMITSPIIDDRGDERWLSDAELAMRFLDDPSLIPEAVEEMLRWDAPSHYQGRWSTAATEWHGVTIPSDERVILVTGAANHDPRVYEDPTRFLIGRTIDRPLSFGWGIHLCLGANLARMETQIAFEEFLDRFPDWELDEANIVRLRSGNVRGLARLPITYR